MNDSFERTAEYQQSLRMRPACDRVLCEIFDVTPDRIQRYNKGDLFVLDQEFAIDLRVKLKNGSQVTGQEKALSFGFYKYRTFTCEFYQNRFTKEPGEFFKIASQFYLHGYSDDTGVEFIEWKIINVLQFIDWLRKYTLEGLAGTTRDSGPSRATFLPIPYDTIPKECLFAEWRR